MEQICYIIESSKGYFKPFIGIVTPDDDDSSLYPIASGNKGTLEEAQKFLKENSGEMKFYLNSVKSNLSGLTWLSEILNANSL